MDTENNNQRKIDYLYIIETDGESPFEFDMHQQIVIPKYFLLMSKLRRVLISYDIDAWKSEDCGPNRGFRNEFTFMLADDSPEHVNKWAQFFANHRYILLLDRGGLVQVMYSRYDRCRASFVGTHPSCHTFKVTCSMMNYPFNIADITIDKLISSFED